MKFQRSEEAADAGEGAAIELTADYILSFEAERRYMLIVYADYILLLNRQGPSQTLVMKHQLYFLVIRERIQFQNH
jgi:hypothetical protein